MKRGIRLLALTAVVTLAAIVAHHAAGAELPPRGYMPLVAVGIPGHGGWKGVAKAAGGDSLRSLGTVAWHYDWQPRSGWGGEGWVPLVRPQDCDTPAELDALAALAAAHLARVWLVFNEPDLASQDHIAPQEGAALYGGFYDAVKGADPWAKLYCCGTAFSNTAWLESFRQAAARPVDGVHFHGYPCRSADSQACEDNYWGFYDRYDTALAFSKMDAFHAYLQGKPEFAGKPVWLSEFGIISAIEYEPGYEHVRDSVMMPFLSYLEGGGLDKFRRVAWFSDRYLYLSASDLTYADDTLTPLGVTWNGAGQ